MNWFRVAVKAVYVVILFANNVALLGQQTFTIELSISKNINPEQLMISLDDGKQQKEILPAFTSNEMTIYGESYAIYPSIQISFPINTDTLLYFQNLCFITDSVAKISLHMDSLSKEVRSKTSNVLSFDKEQKCYKGFYAKAEKEFLEYYQSNINRIAEDDSINREAFAKADMILERKTEYVKQSAGTYFDFWVFSREIVYNNLISSDSLLHLYYSKFPKKFRDSYEGKRAVRIIKGRNIKKGQRAINFEARDIYGQIHRLSDFKGKFLLINFWASWCGPCIEELPTINKIHEQFDQQKLEILFFTCDTDEKKFQGAVQKYGIDWGDHFYASPELVEDFGAQALPKLYLIDPEGLFLYTRDEENDGKELKKLREILNNKIE